MDYKFATGILGIKQQIVATPTSAMEHMIRAATHIMCGVATKKIQPKYITTT